jgi:hypothetical protein
MHQLSFKKYRFPPDITRYSIRLYPRAVMEQRAPLE